MSGECGLNFDLHWGTRIPLRDGVELSATVYTPRPQSEPVPCIVALTPYVADSLHPRGVYFASHGHTFVAVDVRGRGNSGGTFRPYIQEAQDGYDVVEWLSKQRYCNGQVAMWGGSYLGYAQWATAKEFPPHLATIVPAAAPCIGVDFPMRNNIFYPYLWQWLNFTAGRTAQTKIFADNLLWSGLFRQWHESGKAFRELGTPLGELEPLFAEWVSHPEPDAYLDAYNPTADQYARLDLPILTITGSNDDDQPGALEHYRQHQLAASAAARERHYLIIGPWDHAGTSTPSADFGGIKCAAASLLDLPGLLREWYAWTMQNGPKPSFLKQRVAYYVMGAECWRYADTLEAVTACHETCFLDSASNASDVFAAGSLGPKPGAGAPDTYHFDPRDTRGFEIEAESRSDGNSLIDQSVILALRGKLLVYHSAPFVEATEISGFFRLSAWLAIDCPDTDIYASIHEIGLDGSSIRLSTDAIRARYREGLRTPRLIQTCEPLRYDLERFTFVSRRVERGHRLRLVIAPMGRLIGSTFTEKNYNGGGVVAQETVADARPVTMRLFHDSTHPSALYIPLGRGKSEEGSHNGCLQP